MINGTVIKRQSVGKVVNYYSDGADDYYSKEGEAITWAGKGAEDLGLTSQPFDKKRFSALLDGQIDEKTKLRRFKEGDAAKERLAVDLTFSAPKSVSLQALVHGDKEIIAAHDRAVQAAVKEAEALAAARLTKNHKVSVQKTGNVVAALFRHETSREQEPQLHTHAVLLNMTRREDGKWRALMNDSIVKNLEYLGNVYNATLAHELEKQGFQIRYEKNGAFDLAHFSREQIEAFSSRTGQINQALEQKGLDRETATAKERNEASLRTRKKKTGMDREQMHQRWQETSKAVGIDFTRREWAGPGGEGMGMAAKIAQPAPELFVNPRWVHADEAISHAVRSNAERQTNIKEMTIINAAIRHSSSSLSTKDLRAALDRAVEKGTVIQGEGVYAATTLKGVDGQPLVMGRSDWIARLKKENKLDHEQAETAVEQAIQKGRLVFQERSYTTAKAIKTERDILHLETVGRRACNTTVREKTIDKILATKTLSAEQQAAVKLIATTQNRFVGVPGFAGVGKSYLTMSAKEILEAGGYKVEALAPYANQVKSLQGEGMPARVVAAFLHAKDKAIDEKTVVFIDEAGVIPARQMRDLMATIEKHGARAVFLGDTSQTKAVEAGKPFEQLINHGMDVSRVTEIQRQKSNPELLKAVQLAAEQKTHESIKHVETIHTVEVAAERHEKIALDYARRDPEARLETVVVTGTNDSRKEINDEIRRALGLEGKGETYSLLTRYDSTQAERQNSKYFEVGTVVVPESNYKRLGLERGQQYKVIDNGPGNLLTVQGEDGKIASFSPKQARLSVYKVDKSELAVGDIIRITRNDKNLDLANGDKFFVREIEDGRLSLSKTPDGPVSVHLSADAPMFVQPAYVTTAHSAQGMTKETAILNIDTRTKTTTMETYYVALSRAKNESIIYTDDLSRLPKAISRPTLKTAALELHREEANRSAGETYLSRLRAKLARTTERTREDAQQDRSKAAEKGKEPVKGKSKGKGAEQEKTRQKGKSAALDTGHGL